jgi:hypothetical protein
MEEQKSKVIKINSHLPLRPVEARLLRLCFSKSICTTLFQEQTAPPFKQNYCQWAFAA